MLARIFRKSPASRRRGTSMVEFALLAPWYIVLFIGAFDFGFYSYALIATQNAARVVAMYCSASSSRASACGTSPSSTNTSACSYALNQLTNLPNMGSAVTGCTASPLVLTASVVTVTGDTVSASQASVAYTTTTLIPIPGLLPGTVTITRTATMRILS